MPRASRAVKEAIVADLAERIGHSVAVLFTDFHGIKTADLASIREQLGRAGITYKVVKNTLLGLALKRSGQTLPEALVGRSVAAAFVPEDEIAASKLIYQFARSHEALEILGGFLRGEWLSRQVIEQFALLPSREELFVRLVGAVASPPLRLVRALAWPPRAFLSVLGQYQQKAVGHG